MTTAVLYARYSTDLQSAASAEDQLRLLRQRAQQEGWQIVAEHADRAISGTVRDRPGLNACLAMIESGAATVLMAEALDRVSRDQEDVARFYKRVRFAGAKIVTLSEGEIGTLHIGMGGTISAIYIEQLAQKTRRGQIGRVTAGRIPGGLSYGYRAVRRIGEDGELERGLREIDEDQAAIVRRIFAEYADGKSPLAIAAQLNAEGLPSPRGGLWRANAITGHRARGNGILHNELYIGRIVYNRQTFRKDPETRKRVARSNAADDRVTTEVPALRIIDEDLWQRVQDRLAAYAGKPAHVARRPKRLLSGLMRCGVCGGSFIAIGPGRWGCSDHKQTGTCPNGSTITDAQAQRRIWAALQRELLKPDALAAYLDEWRRLENEARRETNAARAAAEARLDAIDAEELRIVDAIVAGVAPARLVGRSKELEAEREQINAELAATPQPVPVIHPGMAENYRRQVAALHEAADSDEARENSRALLLRLIDKIEVTPRQGARGADLTVHGQLAALLQIQNDKNPAEAGLCMSTMVAGVGAGHWHTIPIAA